MKTPSSLAALALVLLIDGTGFAGSYTWNAATGYWTNASGWLPVGVPAETDTVTVGQGRVYLPADPALALDDFHLQGGEIRGAFDVRGVCEWANGVMALGTNTVRTNAVLRLVGDGTKTLAGIILNNEGWVAWTNASRIAPEGNCAINNQPGGLFDAQGDGYVNKTAAGACSFNNHGLFRKTGGTGSTWFSGLPFNSSGAVEIQTGSLSLKSGGTLSGSLVAWAGSHVELASGTFTLSSDVTALNVELAGGTIGGTHTLHGDLSWTGAKLANGCTTIATNCTLRLSGDTNKALSFHNLTNEGSVVWTGAGLINPQGNCVIHNAAGGTFEARGGAGVNTTAGISSFVNSGLFRQTGGTNGTWFSGLPFNSSGTVEIQTGNLWLNGGGTLSGNLVAWPGSQIELAGGTFTLDGDVTALKLKLSGGTAGGTSTLHGQVNWTGGILANGRTTVATNGTLLLSEDTGQILSAHVLNNEGWIVWSNASRLTPKGNCLITNQAGGTFEVWGDGSIDRSGYAGSCTFYNLGTFRKSGGTGQTRIVALPFVNSGAVEVLTGALVLSSGGSLGGSIVATNGAEVLLTGGNFTLDGDVTAINVKLSGGTISGSGTLHGLVNWTSGSLSSGVTTVATNCTLRLWDDTEKFLSSHVLTNEGWLVWSNNCRLTPAGTGAISNLPNATFEAWGDGSIDRSGYAGSCTFYNLGTFRKSGGTGQTRLTALYFVNQGNIEVRAGTLRFDSGYTQISGATFLAGGNISAGAQLEIQGGCVTGSGDIAASLKNGGMLSPGNSIGQINILSDFTQTSGGTLHIELAGRDPGQYNQVKVSGNASLAGTIEVALTNGFTPVLGDTFCVLTCASRSGTFAVTNGCSLSNGLFLTPEYRTNGVFLVAAGPAAPVTINPPVLTGTNMTFALSTTTGTSYTLQATGALVGEPWQDILSFTGDGLAREIAIAIQTSSNRYFRVRVGN